MVAPRIELRDPSYRAEKSNAGHRYLSAPRGVPGLIPIPTLAPQPIQGRRAWVFWPSATLVSSQVLPKSFRYSKGGGHELHHQKCTTEQSSMVSDKTRDIVYGINTHNRLHLNLYTENTTPSNRSCGSGVCSTGLLLQKIATGYQVRTLTWNLLNGVWKL